MQLFHEAIDSNDQIDVKACLLFLQEGPSKGVHAKVVRGRRA
jgi:hypothetical protein